MAMPHSAFRPIHGLALAVVVAAAMATWSLVQAPSIAAALTAMACLAALAAVVVMVRRPTGIPVDPSHGEPLDQAGSTLLREDLDRANRAARMGQWEWRPGDDTLWWSPELCELYGVGGDSIPATADQALALVHPDDHDRMSELVRQVRQGSQFVATQFRIRRPDGGMRSIAAEAMARTLASGEVVIRGVQRDVTERSQIRRRLQLAEAQHRFLFEHTPVSMWVFDRDTLQLLAINEEVTRKFGDVSGMETSPDSLAMLDFDRFENPAVDQARQHGTSASQDSIWAYQCRDGTTLHSVVHSQQIDFEGRPAWLVAAQDATEQQRAQNLYQLVAAATNDGIYEWDMTRNALWLSDNFFEHFGYERTSSAPTIGLWKARIHPDDLTRVMATLAAAANGDADRWECEYELERGDGIYVGVLHHGFFLREPDGSALRMVGGLVDLTESRRIATDLRLLRRAIESITTGIVIVRTTEPGHPVVYANKGLERITGYSTEEVVGHSCRYLEGGSREQAGFVAIRTAIEEEKELQVTLRNTRKNGEAFWGDVHLSPLHDDNGALTHYIAIITDVTERHHYEEQLAYRATHDDLTGLPNRQLVVDRLGHAIAAARRRAGTATVMFIDIDNFKMINDMMGHATGDFVLTAVADRLAGVIRGTDTAGRFGGDEFVLILEDQASLSHVGQMLERVTRALTAPLDIGGASTALTVSIGHCSYPVDGATADALLLHADIAMYHAKRRGRNRAVAYDPDFHESDSTYLQLVSRLREALHHKEFSLVFQPLFVPGGRAVALEALIRWDHPEKGRLLPAHFISACEDSGLIVELERGVLASAAQHHQLLRDAGFGHIRIAVNVSSSHFVRDLYADVESVVKQFGLPPGALELELTESVIMENPESAIATMTRLATLGVSTTVDDFGTGYSSLAYLKRLPIMRVKIDRAFVRDLNSDLSDRSICESIISLAQSMDLRTVAEGVETKFQLDWLKEHGIDELQGYLLGRPAPFQEVLSVLSMNR